MLYVGQIQYINVLPLFCGFLNQACSTDAQFVQATPTRLNRLLRENSLDLSMISSIEYLCRPQDYLPFANLAIVAKGAVESVCLYTRLPIEELHLKKIAITKESASAVKLLQILCKYLWKIQPIFVPLSETSFQSEAFLLIGDQSLLHQNIPGYNKIDLAQCWYHLTKLPFVFSLFVMHRKAFATKIEEINQFQHDILASYQWSCDHKEQVVLKAQQQVALDQDILENYFSLLSYHLGKEELKGLKTFAQYCGFSFNEDPFTLSYNLVDQI